MNVPLPTHLLDLPDMLVKFETVQIVCLFWTLNFTGEPTQQVHDNLKSFYMHNLIKL